MSEAMLEIQEQGSVVTVWLNRAPLHNAFNAQLIQDLIHCFKALHTRDDVRVVVLAGKGKSFSAGADLNWMQELGQADFAHNQQDAEQLALMLYLLNTLPQTTIARVQGAALGGGMGLASACDICIASDKAVFATSEVRFGLAPSTISPYVLAAIGQRQASRYFLSAERINAEQALAMGLVHEVCAPEALDERIVVLINELLKGSQKAQAACKELIRMVVNQPVTEELRIKTSKHIAALRSSEEAKEGLDAFLNKRAATWCESHDMPQDAS